MTTTTTQINRLCCKKGYSAFVIDIMDVQSAFIASLVSILLVKQLLQVAI